MAARFGTDGIRGPAGTDITADLALALGRAVGHRLADGSGTVVLGRDTRRSGEMLSAALAAGLSGVGANVLDLGVVTTPCLVHATTDATVAAGIMVSASHNPAPDNGLKVVASGRKLPDAIESDLEALLDNPAEIPWRPNERIGRLRVDPGPIDDYRRHLAAAAGDASPVCASPSTARTDRRGSSAPTFSAV